MVGRGTSGGRLKRPPSQAMPPASHPPPTARTRTDTEDTDEQLHSQPGVAGAIQRAVAAALQPMRTSLAEMAKQISELRGHRDHMVDELSALRQALHLTQVAQ